MLARINREEEASEDELRVAKRSFHLRTVSITLLGLVLGFFFGEALAAMVGMITSPCSAALPPSWCSGY
jgi:hypothetical protein